MAQVAALQSRAAASRSLVVADVAFGSDARAVVTVGIIRDAGTGFTITYSVKNDQSQLFRVTTDAFTIGVASIAVTVQPAASYQYALGSPVVSASATVSLRSSDGDNLDHATTSVSAELTETAGALVSGSVASSLQSAAAAGGTASFTYTISLESGDSYRMTISSPPASTNTDAFAINPFEMVVASQPLATVQYAAAATAAPIGTVEVLLKDGAGNTLVGSSSDSRLAAASLQERSGEK